MLRMIKKLKSDAMIDIYGLYLEAGGTEPVDLDKLARFAINNGHWNKSGSKLVQLCKRELSRAFREQYHTDLQGRNVRTFHAIHNHTSDGEQKVFWADMRTASAEHLELAFQQRRSQIIGGCRQLKVDVDSFNDNNTYGRHFQLILDFRDDVAEREQPITYKPNIISKFRPK